MTTWSLEGFILVYNIIAKHPPSSPPTKQNAQQFHQQTSPSHSDPGTVYLLHLLDLYGKCSYIYIYIYMGAAHFPGPPNLHDLQNWFKQLILQLPICICIVQHVTWEIGLPSFIETIQGVRSAPHRSFTLHKVFQWLVKKSRDCPVR